MPGVHILHLRQVGEVGHALGVGGGDLAGQRALEAVADGVEADPHRPAPRALPAFGPGVWENPALGVKLTTTSSSASLASTARMISPE